MTTEDSTLDFHALLVDERAHLETQLGELGAGEGTSARLTYDSNFADTSQVTAERGENEALVKELRSALREVERALVRLDEGTYGICEVCKRPIAPARLEAMPAVTTCIEHATTQR